MLYTRYRDVKVFHRDVFNILLRHEAQNIISLGNVIIGNKGEDKFGWRDPAHWFMATVSDAGGIVLTAVMTPPHNLTLYATDNANNEDALACLINAMINAGVPCPGVTAEKSLAKLFAETYRAKQNMGYEIRTRQRIYELTRVNPECLPNPSSHPSLSVRLTRESDMAFLPYWGEAFASECFGTPMVIASNAEAYHYIINRKNRCILEDGGVPVAMAGISRELVTVCAIGPVYTPPYFRRKGYAAACTAAVSQIGLDKGFKKCVLYTDLANPVSNGIYMKIGYAPICDSLDILFNR
jgi:hypothetical protein